MVVRLGEVLYWLFCGIAAIILASGAWLYFYGDMPAPNRPFVLLAVAVVAFLTWLAGRALLYILAGR